MIQVNTFELITLMNECENTIKIEANETNNMARTYFKEYSNMSFWGKRKFKEDHAAYSQIYYEKIEFLNFYMNVIASEKNRLQAWSDLFEDNLETYIIPKEFQEMLITIKDNFGDDLEDLN